MVEENFSPEQSLLLIRTMIGKTRQDMSEKSIYFLVWGWITFIACTAQFLLKHVFHFGQHYLVWLLVFVGIGLTFYYGSKQTKQRKVETYVGDSLRYLWMGMGISYFVLSMILSRLGWETAVFPFFILLYGLGTFVSGKIIRFKPLIVGGMIASVLAIAAAYVDYDFQMLFGSAAILVSYIVPAYMLRKKNRNATS
jgi:hypothetical protein